MPNAIPLKTSTPIDPLSLSFDLDNPRFTPDKRPEGAGDADVIRLMFRTSDLEELVQSISNSGYIPIEPLVIIERNGKNIVLEGNRRLAAIKFLRQPELQDSLGKNRVDLPKAIASTLDNVLVYRVDSEDDARALIGFKHINGPHAWDAHAKAIFATNWLDHERAKSADGLSLNQISAQMGDGHQTLKKMVLALYVLRQAEDNGLFDIDDRAKKSFSFSHLYTGLGYKEFLDYLGIPSLTREQDPYPNPVPDDKLENLKQMLIWLYGSKAAEIDPIIQSQNPNLRELRQVLTSKSATAMLENAGKLDQAVTASIPKDKQFEHNLTEANMFLHYAQITLDGFDANSQGYLLEVAEESVKKMRLIHNFMKTALENQYSENEE